MIITNESQIKNKKNNFLQLKVSEEGKWKSDPKEKQIIEESEQSVPF